MLKELAVITLAQSRSHSIDICCRYGGKEFAIIMPEMELHNAITVAERLRKSVKNNMYPLKDNIREGNVAISLGITSINNGEELSAEKLIKKPRCALYLKKREKSGKFQPIEKFLKRTERIYC